MKSKENVIHILDDIARELARFVTARVPGDEIWDGRRFTTIKEYKAPDPAAVIWWHKIVTMTSLLSSQDLPLTDGQQEFLRKQFFGGMGSFQDLPFDEKAMGLGASGLNSRLGELIQQLSLVLRK